MTKVHKTWQVDDKVQGIDLAEFRIGLPWTDYTRRFFLWEKKHSEMFMSEF